MRRATPMSAARSCSRCSKAADWKRNTQGTTDMSRIGKRAVSIPSGVTANVEGQTVKMKGPKGALELVLPAEVKATLDKGSIKVDPRNETKRARSMWGTSRTLVSNLVAGVTKGFER